MYQPSEILEISIINGTKKIDKSLLAKIILGFIGGAMIALGFLADIRVSASIPGELSSIKTLVGASIFPVGLIIILLAGGELVTGNMMAVSSSFMDKKISFLDFFNNLFVITLANVFGAIFVAYFFGHVIGLTTDSPYLDSISSMAQGKINTPWFQDIISGIGCNWFVGLAVWLCYGAKDGAGKILGIWFPVMTFVAIGFQHSIANSFVIPAAIFEGIVTWSDFIYNLFFVYIGNIIGGAVFVSGFYYLSYTDYKKNPNC